MKIKLKKIIAEVMENPDLESTLNLDTDLINEIGIDSLGMINLLIKIEDTFDVRVDYENLEFEHLQSLNILISFIQNLIEKQSNSNY